MIDDNARVIGVLSSGACALSALNMYLHMFLDALSINYIKVEGINMMMFISLLLYSNPAFFVICQFNMYLLQLFVILKNRPVHNRVQQNSKNMKYVGLTVWP